MGTIRLKNKSTNLIGLGMMMASRSLMVFFNKGVKESGLSIYQIYALYAVREFEGENISFIANKLGMHRTTLLRTIRELKEYVLIFKDNNDKRISFPKITELGKEFLDKWMPKVFDMERGISLLIGDNQAFYRFISKFTKDRICSG